MLKRGDTNVQKEDWLNDDGMLLAWYQYKTNYIDIRDTIEYLNYVINELDKNILNCFTTDYHIFSTTANSGYTTRPNDSVLIYKKNTR